MKLQFDANQEYQIEAIQTAVDLFNGQPVSFSDFMANEEVIVK